MHLGMHLEKAVRWLSGFDVWCLPRNPTPLRLWGRWSRRRIRCCWVWSYCTRGCLWPKFFELMVIPFNFDTEVACRVSHKFPGNLWHSVEPDSHIHLLLALDGAAGLRRGDTFPAVRWGRISWRIPTCQHRSTAAPSCSDMTRTPRVAMRLSRLHRVDRWIPQLSGHMAPWPQHHKSGSAPTTTRPSLNFAPSSGSQPAAGKPNPRSNNRVRPNVKPLRAKPNRHEELETKPRKFRFLTNSHVCLWKSWIRPTSKQLLVTSFNNY